VGSLQLSTTRKTGTDRRTRDDEADGAGLWGACSRGVSRRTGSAVSCCIDGCWMIHRGPRVGRQWSVCELTARPMHRSRHDLLRTQPPALPPASCINSCTAARSVV